MARPSLDDSARQVLNALPRDIADAETDLRRNLRTAIGGALARLDLVTREEFDAQTRVLSRTREKLEQLEERVRRIEAPPPHGAD